MPQCKRDDTDFRTKEARVWKLFYETAKKKKWSNEKLIENRAYLEKRLEEIANKLKSVCTYKYSTIISEDVKHFFIRPA